MRFVKRFIKIYILTFILLFVFLSLTDGFDMQYHWFITLLVCTFVAAVVILIFVSQQEKIEQLE